MEALSDPRVTTFASFGVIAGLILLARGLSGYRSLVRVGDISTSTIASLAAGEVRVSGIVEPAELTLVSLLQSVPCVYYSSTVGRDQDRRVEPRIARKDPQAARGIADPEPDRAFLHVSVADTASVLVPADRRTVVDARHALEKRDEGQLGRFDDPADPHLASRQ